ncbi:MAG: di-heme enzyme [Deltaproteobacteria bacterium]|nr:di-heme enzyme [Deltaproteobacteria bacterium]
MKAASLTVALVVGSCCTLLACGEHRTSTFTWSLPPGFPVPAVPADNPMTNEKVQLGRRLFYDGRLSGNETQSCASCHKQELAFSDGMPAATGSTGQMTPRGSMALVNVAYNGTQTWANPALLLLEQQIPIPIFGERPVELGATGNEPQILARYMADVSYPRQFAQAFPDDPAPVSFANITKALAAFLRTLISGNSAFDRYTYQNDKTAMSASALRGLELFFTERLECFHCHGGFNFSSSTTQADAAFTERAFHNNGLYNIGGAGSYPPGNRGVFEITGVREDMGKFRAPTLRNIALTAPYMHDGSLATLDDVLDFYAAGGRVIESGPLAGDGRANPFKSRFVPGFVLTTEERADLMAFLQSLTDTSFVQNPSFAKPL